MFLPYEQLQEDYPIQNPSSHADLATTATYLALLGAVLLWGLSFVVTKVALAQFPVFVLLVARFAVAGGLFLLLLLRRGLPRLNLREHLVFLLLAVLNPGLYFLGESFGIKYTSASKASLIIATIPVVVLVLSFLLLRERPQVHQVGGIVLSVAGIALLIGVPELFAGGAADELRGDLFTLGAVVSCAFYIILARRLGSRHDALTITGIQMIWGAVLFAPAGLWQLRTFDLSGVDLYGLGALLYLALGATMGGFLCYNHALTRIAAAQAAVVINCIPVVTAACAWLLLGERLTLLQALGGLVVLGAVTVSNYTPRQLPMPAVGKGAGEGTAL